MKVGYIYTQEGETQKGGRPVRSFVTVRTTEPYKAPRTTLDFVRLGIVSDVGRLGLCDLHETIFLNLRQRNVGFVPL